MYCVRSHLQGLRSSPRQEVMGREGGGIALIYKEYYTINDLKINTNSQCMELSAFDLCIQDLVIEPISHL